MVGTNPGSARSSSGISGSGNVLVANRLVLLLAVPLFLILALCAYLTIQFAANEREAQGWVRHTFQVIGQLELVLSDSLDAETGQRGFLLTKKPEFLATYQASRSRVNGDIATLVNLTRDN